MPQQDVPPKVQQAMTLMSFIGEMASLQLQEAGVAKEVADRMSHLVMIGGLTERMAEGIQAGEVSPEEVNQHFSAERVASLIETGQFKPQEQE